MSSTDVMRARIASELNRALTDSFGNSGETFATVVNREINAAVKHYESARFRWNEIYRNEFATLAAGVRSVSLPANFIAMDSLEVIYSGHYYPVVQIGMADFNRLESKVSATSNSGIPSRFCIHGNVIRIGVPAPGGSYTLAASFIRRFLPTSVTGSYTAVIPFSSYSLTVTTTASHNNRINGWTTDGEELIRQRAKAAIEIHYLKKPSAITEAEGIALRGESFLSVAEMNAFKALSDETFDAQATGRIRKSGL